jgi:photosystem II stability/assembly factor-like uncharacterized protein
LAVIIVVCLGFIGCGETNKPIEPPIEPYDFSWEPISSNLPSDFIWQIKVANNGDIWTYNGDYAIYLSTDNGDTWFQKNNVPSEPLLSINISPVNGYIFFSAPRQGLFRSTDNGENWVRVTDSMNIWWNIFITPSGEIYITGTGDDGVTVYYSSDNGDTWVHKGNILSSNISTINYSYKMILGKDGTLYSGTGKNGVYRSTNGGNTWLPPSNYTNVEVGGITISNDGSIFATAKWTDAVLKSTDKGVTWSQVNMGFDFEYIHNIMYNSITKDILVTATVYTYSGYRFLIYRSTDLGASWELKNDGLPNVVTYSLVFNPNTGQMFASCSDGLIYRSKKK